MGQVNTFSRSRMDTLINATEAANLMGVSDQTFLNWIKQGRVPDAQKVGRTWIIPKSSLNEIDVPQMGRPRKADHEKGEGEGKTAG